MSVDKKLTILRIVEGSGVPVTEALTKLELYPTTHLGRRRRFRIAGREALYDRKSCRNWNQLLPEEQAKVLSNGPVVPGVVEPGDRSSHRRPLRLYHCRIYGLPVVQGGGLDQAEKHAAVPGILGIPRQDEVARSDVSDGRNVPAGEELGLVLPDFGAGRLQPKDPGAKAPERHGRRRVHLSARHFNNIGTCWNDMTIKIFIQTIESSLKSCGNILKVLYVSLRII